MSFRDRRAKKNQDSDNEPEEYNDATLDLLDQLGGFDTSGARAAKAATPQVIERIVEVEKPVEIFVTAPAIEQMERGIRIGSFLVTSVGLEFADGLTEEEWIDFYKAVEGIKTSLNWILGDYFAYGQSAFHKTYDQMAAFTGLKSETIETYASICRNVPKLIRINSLSFGHHRLVAKFDEHAQIKWLEAAVDNKWSVGQMKRAIEGTVTPTLPPLADRKNKRIISRIWKAVENNGDGLTREDVQHLRRWLDEVERTMRG
jgi:hypothetical protein